MVSSANIQTAYNQMYAEVRKYIWDFPAVACLADLEIAVYKACQDLADVRTKFYRFKSFLTDLLHTDEDLARRVDAFESIIQDNEVYVKLNQVEEVIQV